MNRTAPDPVVLAQELIRCQSVTPHEAGALTLLQDKLQDLGFACQRLTFSEPDTFGLRSSGRRLSRYRVWKSDSARRKDVFG